MNSREENLIWCLMGISFGALITLACGLVFMFVSKDRVLAAFENDAFALGTWSIVLALIGAAIASIAYCTLRFLAFKEEKEILEERDRQISDLRTDVAKKDAEIARLEDETAFAERNADVALRESGEDLEHVRLCERTLRMLSSLEGDQTRTERYIGESLSGTVADNEAFGGAFEDLRRYECIECDELVKSGGRGYSAPAGLAVTVLKRQYPSLAERREANMQARITENVEASTRKIAEETVDSMVGSVEIEKINALF